MEWKKLTTKTMPPVDNHKSFLLWLGLNEDGGFPVLAKRVQYNAPEPYIRYCTCNGWKALGKEEYAECFWAAIEPPGIARGHLFGEKAG